jgi:DivIVA domain-containing protein
MAIDIKNINEITFTQRFRGYDTEEVDKFLDDLLYEAVESNKETEELKKRIKELEDKVYGKVGW